MKKTSTLLFCLLALFLFSCKKKTDTCTAENQTYTAAFPITGDTAVYAGDSIHLSAAGIPNVTYQWTGPNYFTAYGQRIVVPTYNASFSGPYTVVYTSSDGCINHTESKSVKIKAPKTSCNPPANTINFGGQQEPMGGGYISSMNQLVGNSNNFDMYFSFKSTPVTGVYQVVSQSLSTSDMTSYQVQIYVNSFYTYAASSGLVYVVVNNGTITASFCDLSFSYDVSVNCTASISASF